MSQKQINIGARFAYAYYCPQLHLDQPAATYAFSELRWFRGIKKPMGVSRVANILWRGSHRLSADQAVKAKFEGAEFRGIFTTNNYLLIGDEQHMQPLSVVGPRVSLTVC